MSVIRVVKVGGSLFDWPSLPRALDGWISAQAAAINVLIAGGGSLVDTIRRASQTFSLDDETAHWLSIDAMSINATFLAGFLPDAESISTYRELRTAIEMDSCRRLVFDAREFLREHESKLAGCVLPHDWSVTSDSIAARVAEVLKAEELVLLKSADPSDKTTTTLVDAGFVDRYFLAFDDCGFRRQFVNLRHVAKCPVEVEIRLSST
jgi:aspartokinase-like uncharacterized kinase